MELRVFGRTGMKLSVLGFGSMLLTPDERRSGQEKALEALRT